MNLRHTRVAALCVGAAVVLGLGACSAHPGAAVSVNNDEFSYSTAELEEGVRQLSEAVGQPLVPAQVVGAGQQFYVVTAMADKLGITTDDQAVSDFLASAVDNGQFVAQPSGEPGRFLRDFARVTLLSQQLKEAQDSGDGAVDEAYMEVSQTLKADVNPRYTVQTAPNQFGSWADVVPSEALASLKQDQMSQLLGGVDPSQVPDQGTSESGQ